MTQGTERTATAERRAGTFHAAATGGDPRRRARRRREAFARLAGTVTRNRAAGTRNDEEARAARTREAIPRTIAPSKTANAAAAYVRTTGRGRGAIGIW